MIALSCQENFISSRFLLGTNKFKSIEKWDFCIPNCYKIVPIAKIDLLVNQVDILEWKGKVGLNFLSGGSDIYWRSLPVKILWCNSHEFWGFWAFLGAWPVRKSQKLAINRFVFERRSGTKWKIDKILTKWGVL